MVGSPYSQCGFPGLQWADNPHIHCRTNSPKTLGWLSTCLLVISHLMRKSGVCWVYHAGCAVQALYRTYAVGWMLLCHAVCRLWSVGAQRTYLILSVSLTVAHHNCTQSLWCGCTTGLHSSIIFSVFCSSSDNSELSPCSLAVSMLALSKDWWSSKISLLRWVT